MLVLFWEGDRTRAHNQWRQCLLAHYSPRPGGEALVGPICYANWGEVRAEKQIAKASWWAGKDLPVDVYWVDAAWYGDAPFQEDSTVFNSQWYRQTGNWWPNPEVYPEGLGPVGEAVQAAGMKFLLWVEPERARIESRLPQEHPDWVLGPIGDNYLVDLGNPEAREGMTELLSDLITAAHLGVYRQDFNMDPAPF
jgi:alpha-galactosidase